MFVTLDSPFVVEPYGTLQIDRLGSDNLAPLVVVNAARPGEGAQRALPETALARHGESQIGVLLAVRPDAVHQRARCIPPVAQRATVERVLRDLVQLRGD
jgi:hypothetical protein